MKIECRLIIIDPEDPDDPNDHDDPDDPDDPENSIESIFYFLISERTSGVSPVILFVDGDLSNQLILV